MIEHGKEYIAYFSMEIGLTQHIPTYAGGLGVLAGDILKSFADLGFPAIGVTLLSENGYFYQKIDDQGNQIEEPINWNVDNYLSALPNVVEVDIEGRKVRLKVWRYIIEGINGNTVPVFFLDSRVEGNSDYDRSLTSVLYGGDMHYRLCQEVILGVGGLRMLESLGYRNIKKYHMNEGHPALLAIELLKRNCSDCDCNDENQADLASIKEKCVFTTHTPVTAGIDWFDLDLVHRVLGDYIPHFILDKSLRDNKLNMTLLGLNMSNHINGVSKRHEEISKRMFPGCRISSITNGIHTPTWASKPMQELFDRYIAGWKNDPLSIRNALSIPKDDIWDAHLRTKQLLIEEVNLRKNLGFDVNSFTLGFAKRFTAYKRPDLLIRDLPRLAAIAGNAGGIQVVYAGKAHAGDGEGKDILRHVYNTCRDVGSRDPNFKMVFLEQYDMRLSKIMTSGCDVWLNNPQRPLEASGTSGMKAALNGVPQISTLDGWWLEGHVEDVTGWSIGAGPHDPEFNDDPNPDDEIKDLYEKLGTKIVPCFYGNRDKWIEMMRHTISINGSFFNARRVAMQYITQIYLDVQ